MKPERDRPITELVLTDTGPIVAMLSKGDEFHDVCVEQMRRIKGPLLTCWPVITEAAWLLRAYPRAIGKMLAALDGRTFRLAALTEPDAAGVAAIFEKYRTLGIQLADAALVHLASRDGIGTIFTLNRPNFGMIRSASGNKFRLIP